LECDDYSCDPYDGAAGCKTCVQQSLRRINNHCATCGDQYQLYAFQNGDRCQGIPSFAPTVKPSYQPSVSPTETAIITVELKSLNGNTKNSWSIDSR
jgi:hypothetical protein